MEWEDKIGCECNIEALESLVSELEKEHEIRILQMPLLCMTMVEAEDSVQFQPFYLGEALTTETEVQIEDKIGLGICLGDEPVRSYCIAVLDALFQFPGDRNPKIAHFLNTQRAILLHENLVEHNHILRTKVDFKLMEQD